MPQENRIKAVIFDFDGVVVTSLYPVSFKFLSKLAGVDWKKLEIETRKLRERVYVNDLSEDNYWEHLEQAYGINKEKALRIAYSLGSVKKPVLKLVKRLRKHYKVMILSNHFENWFSHLIARHRLASEFDFIFTSFGEKIAKPDKRIFRRVLKKIGMRPSECIFIDDQKHYVKAAEELGIFTIHFKTSSDLERKLKKLVEF